MPTPFLTNSNLSATAESRKYIERSPRTARMLDEKTINGSVVIAKMAGMESIANTRSVDSIISARLVQQRDRCTGF